MGWFINFVWWYCYGFVLLFSLLVVYRPSVCQLVTSWRSDFLLLGWLLSCFPNYIRCGCLLICFVFVLLTWIEIDWFINRSIGWIDWLIDWLIDRPIDRLIDWLIARLVVCRLAMVVHSFGLFCWFWFFDALRPWALWPLRVSVGPSWFCGADFRDGKVQKLGTISTRLGVTVEYSMWPCGTWSSPLARIYV